MMMLRINMLFLISIILIIQQSTIIVYSAEENINNENNCDYSVDPLILTPLIKCGKISLAKDESRVQNWTSIESYSGFLTVNQTYNSNLYFWFFPALKNPKNAPLILWLQGGPGTPTFFGLFVEHGPLQFDNNKPGTIHYREHPWTEEHSIIYIDNPVGTGFSYTDSFNGYANNMDDVSRDLYEALIQFFTLFPEYKKQDFFIGGQSYAGKYVPAIAHHIHKKQERNLHWSTGVKINLKGIFIGAPLVDPRSQLKYADFLYNTGLIDENQWEVVKLADDELARLIDEKRWGDAYTRFMDTLLGGLNSYLHAVSGFIYTANILQPSEQPYALGEDVIGEDWFRAIIHVGNNITHGDGGFVRLHLQEDVPKSTKYMIEKLLNENYKILFYGGQLDIIVPSVSIESLIHSMNWMNKQKYLDAERKIWIKNNEIAGFIKQADNLYHVLVRKAGHNSPYDQPEWCYDLIYKFTRGITFDDE